MQCVSGSGADATPPKQTLDAFVLADGIICSHIVNFLTSHSVYYLAVCISLCAACAFHTVMPRPSHRNTSRSHAICNLPPPLPRFFGCVRGDSARRLSLALFHKPATLARPGPASVSALALAVAAAALVVAIAVGLGIWLQFVNFWYHNTNSKSETMNCETLCCNCN